MMAMQHANGKWKKLLPPIGKDNKLLKARQQPKHRKNGIDDNNNTNNINRFAIINNEIGSRYSAKPDPTNDHTSDPTTDPTFEPTFEPTYDPTMISNHRSKMIIDELIQYMPSVNNELIKLENVTATWDDEMNQLALSNINAIFRNNTTTMIIGETGSGKSALLRTILGNLSKSNGSIIYGESPSNTGQQIKIAYSSQVAWIRNATLKENILFDSEFNEDLYNDVI
eukprot:297242_1